ncbi:hypothetical protein BJX70DRAFT_357772 [Aspergillus crustosus]
MKRDMVEGNSTSQASTYFPNPEESPALMASSHTHMNDLGLTPSPGHQLPGDILQNEASTCFDERETVDIGGRDGLKQIDIQTSLDAFEAQANIIFDNETYDPLFDSTIPELDSVFSRKRTAEGLELPPEKRQHLATPAETPSLTPGESTADFFENFDQLFAGEFDPSLFQDDVLPDDVLPDFEEEIAGYPPSPPISPPVVSDATKERFSLHEQDIISNLTQGVLQVSKVPEYASPYPVPGGRLGYLPSAPSLHVKYIAVGDEEKKKSIASLQREVSELKRERDKIKKSLVRYEKLDSEGRSHSQLLEENSTLRRVSGRHQARVDEYRKDATEWRNKLHALSTIYNNLLYEIQVEQRVPTVNSAQSGYQPRPLSASLQAQVASHFGLNRTPTPAPQISLQHTMVIPHGNNQPRPSAPSQQPDRARAVTIDLTEEDEDPTRPPIRDAETCTTALQSLRAKKYDWLQARNESPNTPLPSPSLDDDELAEIMERELSRA